MTNSGAERAWLANDVQRPRRKQKETRQRHAVRRHKSHGSLEYDWKGVEVARAECLQATTPWYSSATIVMGPSTCTEQPDNSVSSNLQLMQSYIQSCVCPAVELSQVSSEGRHQ